MSKLLNCTLQAQKILRQNGFKKGTYRIQNRSNRYAYSGHEYKDTFIYMRVSVLPEVIDNLIKDGLRVHLLRNKPIFKY